MVLTCRSFYQGALVPLWSSLPALKPLIDLVMEEYTPWDGQINRSLGLYSSDWRRFEKHAVLVQHLSFYDYHCRTDKVDGHQKPVEVSTSIMHDIICLRQGRFILPNLRSLHVWAGYESRLLYSLPLLGPTVKVLYVGTNKIHREVVELYLSAVKHAAPRLETVRHEELILSRPSPPWVAFPAAASWLWESDAYRTSLNEIDEEGFKEMRYQDQCRAWNIRADQLAQEYAVQLQVFYAKGGS